MLFSSCLSVTNALEQLQRIVMIVGCDARIKNGSRSLGSAANEETVGTARVTIRTRCRGGLVERKVGNAEVGNGGYKYKLFSTSRSGAALQAAENLAVQSDVVNTFFLILGAFETRILNYRLVIRNLILVAPFV